MDLIAITTNEASRIERSLSNDRAHAINVAQSPKTNRTTENESNAESVSRTRDRSKVVNGPIYARIGRIRPLGHHGPRGVVLMLGV